MVSLLILAAARAAQNHRSGGPWTPANLAIPPKVWANDTSAVTDNGGGIASRWTDISGNGNDFLQSSTNNMPLIVASGLNGLRTLRFDNSSDLMTTASSQSWFQNIGAAWFFAVVKRNQVDSSPIGRPIIFTPVGTSNSPRAALYAGRGTSPYQSHAAAGGARLDADPSTIATGPALDTSYHMLLGVYDWTNHAVTLYMDGAQAAQNTAFGTGGNTSNTAASQNLSIGNVFDFTAPCDADMAEIAVGSTYLLTGGDVDKLFGYAAWHWGLQANLPSGHPYRTAAP